MKVSAVADLVDNKCLCSQLQHEVVLIHKALEEGGRCTTRVGNSSESLLEEKCFSQGLRDFALRFLGLDQSCPSALNLRFSQELLNAPFLNGLFSSEFSRGRKAPYGELGKRPIKAGKRPIKLAKWPIEAIVLVGISVGCLN